MALPIETFREKILAAVAGSPAVVVEAETGAGKSTQVPQYLVAAGYRVVITQPRRLAARTVSARVAYEMGESLGGTIGFRTAMERSDSARTRGLFVTDGLALVRELMGAARGDVLVIDEVHEWNLNIEVLLAWARREQARLKEAGKPVFRLVVMSATMEAEKVAAYLGGAPLVSVPGRMFEVVERPAGRSIAADVSALVAEGRNILVFLPGKKEIEELAGELRRSGLGAEICPLHGEMEAGEQAKAFRTDYTRPKVVIATNVAQTAITISDIDAVIDSGMERRVEVVGGVEGLYLRAISLADRKQRKGRAGRCKVGIYIDHCPAAERAEFPTAEILRVRLDQTVLRLLEAGIDLEELELFHQPKVEEVRRAKETLRALGCVDAAGHVTRVGKEVSRLPVSVQFGRMIVEAAHRGVLDDVVTIAALLEVGEVTMRAKDFAPPPKWTEWVKDERESDVMAQLRVYTEARKLKGNDALVEYGIHVKSFYRVAETRRHLAESLRGMKWGTTSSRKDILLSLCSGMVDHLFRGSYGSYRNGDQIVREIGKESVLRAVHPSPEWIVGLPWDLEIKVRGGTRILRLVHMATKVDPTWLAEVAPHLVSTETGLDPTYDAVQDGVVSTTRTLFRGQVVGETKVPDSGHRRAPEVFARHLAGLISGGY